MNAGNPNLDEQACSSALHLQQPRPARLSGSSRTIDFESRHRTRTRHQIHAAQFEISGSSESPTAHSDNAFLFGTQSGDDSHGEQAIRPMNDQLNDGQNPSPGSAIKCNSCFVCFRLHSQDYTAKVDVAWPHRSEDVMRKVKTCKSLPADEDEHYIWLETVQVAQDTAEEVMQAMNDTLYRHIGRWKKWLWCYEIQVAEEINFWFDDVVRDGRAPISVSELDSKAIETDAQTALGLESPDLEPCYFGHSRECENQPISDCLEEHISMAYTRIYGVRRQHWLRQCLNKPIRAQTRQRFLETGLLQESFVYQEKIFVPTDARGLAEDMEMRGVYVTLGWNMRRMAWSFGYGVTYLAIAIAFVWLATAVYAGKHDWSTAFALGQLIVASIALVAQKTWH